MGLVSRPCWKGGRKVGSQPFPEKSDKREKKELRGVGVVLDFSSATETGAALKEEVRALKSG